MFLFFFEDLGYLFKSTSSRQAVKRMILENYAIHMRRCNFNKKNSTFCIEICYTWIIKIKKQYGKVFIWVSIEEIDTKIWWNLLSFTRNVLYIPVIKLYEMNCCKKKKSTSSNSLWYKPEMSNITYQFNVYEVKWVNLFFSDYARLLCISTQKGSKAVNLPKFLSSPFYSPRS